jgi:copper chaperone CopZ
MDTLEIKASNIKCGGCVSNIQNGLKNIEGITVVNVDIPSNKIIIEGERLDKTVIQTKLAELGYPAVE